MLEKIMSLMSQGGVFMYIILIFSLIGIFVAVERFIYLFIFEKGNNEDLKDRLLGELTQGNVEEAKELCKKHNNSTSMILYTIIEYKNENREKLEERVREVVLSQIPLLERGMWLLGLVGQITPLTGLLGTVSGMIMAFTEIAKVGAGRPELLAKGISMALITTAYGLTVAIPMLVLYNILDRKIDKIINEMEKASVEFMNTLDK